MTLNLFHGKNHDDRSHRTHPLRTPFNDIIGGHRTKKRAFAEEIYRLLEGEAARLSVDERTQWLGLARSLWTERLIPKNEHHTHLLESVHLKQALQEKTPPGYTIVRKETERPGKQTPETTYYWVPVSPTVAPLAEAKPEQILGSHTFPHYELTPRTNRFLDEKAYRIEDPALLKLLESHDRIEKQHAYHDWVKSCFEKWQGYDFLNQRERDFFYEIAAQLLFDKGYILSDDLRYPEQNARKYYQKIRQNTLRKDSPAPFLIHAAERQARDAVLKEQVQALEQTLNEFSLETPFKACTALLKNLAFVCQHPDLPAATADQLKHTLLLKLERDYYEYGYFCPIPRKGKRIIQNPSTRSALSHFCYRRTHEQHFDSD